MPDNELLDIVDEDDKVISRDTKENKFLKSLISRNVGVFARDSARNFIIVKRAPTKKIFPNRLDLSACGNVRAGESYESAASRELLEELGISAPVKFLKKIFNEHEENGKKLRYFTALFLAVCDEEPELNDELSHFEKIALEKLKEKAKESPELFCPFFLKDFKAVERLLE